MVYGMHDVIVNHLQRRHWGRIKSQTILAESFQCGLRQKGESLKYPVKMLSYEIQERSKKTGIHFFFWAVAF